MWQQKVTAPTKIWSKVKGAVCFLCTECIRCPYTGRFVPTEMNQYLAYRTESKAPSAVPSAASAESMWKHAAGERFHTRESI